MKTVLPIFLFLFANSFTYGQTCSSAVFPHANPGGGGGNIHVYSDTTVNDPDGSNYYVCGGAHLTVTYSAGCSYQLEDNASLTIMDHEGDAVFAKGNCTIVDNSIQGIVVNMEATSTFSKPNNTMAGIVFTCSPMVFDYVAVGGTSPCLLSIEESTEEQYTFVVYPNPVNGSESITFDATINQLVIYSLSGTQLAVYEEIESNSIVLNDLQAGVYFAVGTSMDGTRYSTRFTVK